MAAERSRSTPWMWSTCRSLGVTLSALEATPHTHTVRVVSNPYNTRQRHAVLSAAPLGLVVASVGMRALLDPTPPTAVWCTLRNHVTVGRQITR